MSKIDQVQVLSTIEDAIKTSANLSSLSSPITISSKMGEPKEWDSLSFVAVFTAIVEVFGVEAEDDDAIYFMSAEKIIEFLEAIC